MIAVRPGQPVIDVSNGGNRMRCSVTIALLSVALAVAATFAIWQAAGAPWQSANPTQATPASQPVRETQLEKCQRAQIAYETAKTLTSGSTDATTVQAMYKLFSNVLSVCVPEVMPFPEVTPQ